MEGSEEAVETKLNLLIGVTGSVATIKLSPLVTALMALNTYNIRVIATEKASGFIDSITTSLLRSNWVELLTDSNEWGQWKQKGNTVLHIELRKWADIFVIAPLSANTLAKLTNGLCDNLLVRERESLLPSPFRPTSLNPSLLLSSDMRRTRLGSKTYWRKS